MSRRPSIKEMPEGERPRERFVRNGESSLSESELLAIIIRDGTLDETAIDIARALISRFGSLRGISTAGMNELCSQRGIGEAKAVQVQAAFALAKRLHDEGMQVGRQLKSSEEVFHYFRDKMRGLKKELFIGILLDTRGRVIKEEVISEGCINASLVHPVNVFNTAIREAATGVIFVHNHPSGDPEPSSEDMMVTMRLFEVSKLVGVRLHDHIIIGENGYTSLADEGLLDGKGEGGSGRGRTN